MNQEILDALRLALFKLPESERKKKMAMLGYPGAVLTLEELVEEYAKDTEIGKLFEKTLIFNTCLRLSGKG